MSTRVFFIATLVMFGAAHAAPKSDKSASDKMVCVPAADGKHWDCGTPEQPPQPRPVQKRAAPEPPPFLADPTHARRLSPEPESEIAAEPASAAPAAAPASSTETPAPVEAPAPATVVESAPMVEAAPVVEAAPAAQPAPAATAAAEPAAPASDT